MYKRREARTYIYRDALRKRKPHPDVQNCIADLQLHVDDIDEDYIKQSKAILISGTALAESPSREAAIKAVMLAKKNDTKVIFDVDYREYNWKNSDEISIYYSIVAKEADIIMGSREEFDLTEKLIKEGMTDEESASLWQGYNAKIVVIKHGMKGSTAYTCDGQKFSIKPFPVEARGLGSDRLSGIWFRRSIHDGKKQQLFRFPSGTGRSTCIY